MRQKGVARFTQAVKHIIEIKKRVTYTKRKGGTKMSDFLINIRHEEDMLKGNINRMCVTDDVKELNDMYKSALNRIMNIYADCDIRLRLEKYTEHDSIAVDDFMKGDKK